MHRRGPTQPGQEELWVFKHSPASLTDLAVHKKKVEEVLAWCERSFHGGGNRRASILLLIGPTGAGKTITLQVAAKQLKAEVVEWINPVSDANPEPGKGHFLDDQTNQRGAYQESQMSKFAEFLLRTNRYPSLAIFGNETFSRKLLLVEDFPNAVLKDPKHFHELLKSYRRKGAGPLVFVVSENNSSSAGERFLFPPDVQSNLQIDVIRFNPIVTSSMIKALSKIADLESRQSINRVQVPSAESLDQLVVSSAGDIRSAINSLQFFCLNCPKIAAAKPSLISMGAPRKRLHGKALKSSSKSVHLNSKETSIGLRDTNLSLFRALGKILYCKRDNSQKVEECAVLPNFLSTYQRDPLSMVPEEVIEKSHMSPDGFTAFLHQNYLDFYTNLDDIVSASEYFSDADHFTREWSSRSVLEQYSSVVATRGVLFCNTPRGTVTSATSAVGLGWKPLHKPQWFGTVKKVRENSDSVKNLFTEYRLSTRELVMQVLPYLGSIGGSNLVPNQAAVAKELGKFAKFPVRSLPEKLDEKEFSLQEEEGFDEVTETESSAKNPTVGSTNNSGKNSEQHQNNTQLLITENSESEDDFRIEDFDD